MAAKLSTHVLDTMNGCPAASMVVELHRLSGNATGLVKSFALNADGRCGDGPLLDAAAMAAGRYRLVFHPTIETTETATLQQIAQACWDSFEPYVRKTPAPWLWMYKHWRYKPSHPDRPYPSYSQSWKAFDRLVAESKTVNPPL